MVDAETEEGVEEGVTVGSSLLSTEFAKSVTVASASLSNVLISPGSPKSVAAADRWLST